MKKTLSHTVKAIAFLFLILFLLKSCTVPCGDCNDIAPYSNASFPQEPLNLGDVNSPYDDYNSGHSDYFPSVQPFEFIFSSNRNDLGGKNYDFIYGTIEFSWDRKKGRLTMKHPSSSSYYYTTAAKSAAEAANTIQYAEFGPLFASDNVSINNVYYNYTYLLYSNNSSANQDIKFIYSYTSNTTNNNVDFSNSPIINVRFANSPFDDTYPTLYFKNTVLGFCSNRGGNFDIYKTDLNTRTNLLAALSDTTARVITKINALSSPNDDKCPFVFADKIMIFASDRQGGYGGYDLYYSQYSNGEWATPINFGPKINSASNEYRPIILQNIIHYYYNFKNAPMMFSSDRAGGKGGFDLYVVGIDLNNIPN